MAAAPRHNRRIGIQSGQSVRPWLVAQQPPSEERTEMSDSLALAQQAHAAGQLSEAEQLYRRALRQQPGNGICLNNLASILLNRGQARQALRLIDRAITLIPNYADAWSNKAACTGQLQRWDDCRVCARTAIRLNPANPISYIWLSRSQWALDNQQTAQQTLLKARRHPRVRQTTDLWIEYADNLATLGKPAAAARELIRAIGTHVGGEADAITKLIRSLHKLASQLGRESLFIRRASEACTNLESAPADLHYWRARHLLDSDQEKEAILVLMELVRSQPGHAQAWLELGRILRRQKNLHKAAACLERATREAPAEETAWTELCDCLVEDRKSDAALQQITKARLLHPENPKFLLAHCSLLIDEDQPQRAVKLLHGFHAARRMQPPAEALNIEGIALTRLHESAHGMLSRSRALNEAQGILIGTLALTPLSVYRFVHARHHACLGRE
ncbi:MAG: hypothetical protein RLZZ124_1834, partial [Cyanobacteriota bacterium]